MHTFSAEQLVFIDESLFKLQSGWRAFAYAPIGHPARYHDDMTRDETWSVLPAYSTEGYLPCTAIKKRWYNTDQFIEWLQNTLLLQMNPFPQHHSIVVMDNVSIHCNHRIKDVIEAAGCVVEYLPLYSRSTAQSN